MELLCPASSISTSAAAPPSATPLDSPLQDGGEALPAELKEVTEEIGVFADDDEDEEEPSEKDTEPGPGTLREGRVVGIIRKGRREFCGSLRPIDRLKGRTLLPMLSICLLYPFSISLFLLFPTCCSFP